MSGHRTRIKICGVTSPAIALAAAEAGADAVGIVFVPGSPRHVLPGQAMQINQVLPPLISAVGVFRNASDPEIENWRGGWVQLHGDEDEAQVARIARRRGIIRAIAFDPVQIQRWDRNPHVAAILIDGSTPGSGTAFDHAALAELKPQLAKPIILAGGLTPDTVAAAVRAVQPYAVDVSSGVEVDRGVKDAALIQAFCEAVRLADQAQRRKG